MFVPKLSSLLRIPSQYTAWLLLLVVAAYVLRILPYALGYNLPIAQEGMRDFQQVQYLLEHHQINATASYFDYGAFPVLHILVAAIAWLGFDPLRVFLFVPQLFPSIGLIFFYFFLSRYFSKAQSLWAIFCVAVFIPHIYWTAQPVRETTGLFFFPLIIYGLDRVLQPITRQKRWAWWLFLVSSLGLLVVTHHWTSVMVVAWIFAYSLVWVDKPRPVATGLLLGTGFLSVTLLYWFFFFERGLELLYSLLSPVPLVLLLGVLLSIMLGHTVSTGSVALRCISACRTLPGAIIASVLGGSAAVVVGFFLLPINYPLLVWGFFIVLAVLFFIGFFKRSTLHTDQLLLLSTAYLLVWPVVMPLVLLGNDLNTVPFDPFRTAEFIIYPLSPLIAAGILYALRTSRWFAYLAIVLLGALSTMAYPTIYIFNTNFYGTLLYDIRSDLRYISPAVQQLVSLAAADGKAVRTPLSEIATYQEAFFGVKSSQYTLVTAQDQRVKNHAALINHEIAGVSINEYWEDYQSIFPELIVARRGEDLLLRDPLLDAGFISQTADRLLTIGAVPSVTVVYENTGTDRWRTNRGDELTSNHGYSIPLPYDVVPGARVTFFAIQPLVGILGVYDVVWRMHRPGLGFFGSSSPTTTVTLIRE